jgi:hypothetical protein
MLNNYFIFNNVNYLQKHIACYLQIKLKSNNWHLSAIL